jgi:hypothetical protein
MVPELDGPIYKGIFMAESESNGMKYAFRIFCTKPNIRLHEMNERKVSVRITVTCRNYN